MRHKICHASNVEMTVSVTHLLKDTSRFDAKNTADQNGNQVITPFIHHMRYSWFLESAFLSLLMYLYMYIVLSTLCCNLHILPYSSNLFSVECIIVVTYSIEAKNCHNCILRAVVNQNLWAQTFFIFSSVRYMQLAVKQFPSTVIILSISLLFSSFNECNILYCTSTCLPI